MILTIGKGNQPATLKNVYLQAGTFPQDFKPMVSGVPLIVSRSPNKLALGEISVGVHRFLAQDESTKIITFFVSGVGSGVGKIKYLAKKKNQKCEVSRFHWNEL